MLGKIAFSRISALACRPLQALLGLLLLCPVLAPPAAAGERVVRVWHTEIGEATQDALGRIIERFEAANPGVRIEPEAIAWSEIEVRLQSALAAGNPPELSHGQPITCAALQRQGALLPLNDVVGTIGEDNIWEQIKQVCRRGQDYYGLAHAAGTSLLIYRRDLAARLDIAQPRSWAELVEAARRLTLDEDGDGTPEVYGLTLTGNPFFLGILIGELIAANGGLLFDDLDNPRLTDPAVIEVLAFLQALSPYILPGWESRDFIGTFADLHQGRAAMTLQGYGRGASFIEAEGLPGLKDNQAFGVWEKPAGARSDRPMVQVDQEPWMLFRDSAHPEEAKAFLAFLYRDENYLEYIQSIPIHFFPITKSLRRSAAYAATPMIQRWPDWLEVQEFYLDNDLARPTLVIDWTDLERKPYLVDLMKSDILSQMVQAVMLEGVAPEHAALIAQQRAESLVREKHARRN